MKGGNSIKERFDKLTFVQVCIVIALIFDGGIFIVSEFIFKPTTIDMAKKRETCIEKCDNLNLSLYQITNSTICTCINVTIIK